jgi:hypothetical protein
MKQRAFFFFLVGSLALPAALQADGEKYVSAPTAQLKQDKSISAGTVAEVKRGDPLKVEDPGDGRWLKVALLKDPATSGWIYFNKIMDEKPEDVSDQLAFGGGIQTSDLETGGAIRGLKESSQAYAKKSMSPEKQEKVARDLHRIQTFPLTLKDFDKNKNGNLDDDELKAANKARRQWLDQNLEKFLKEGQLGEYAE